MERRRRRAPPLHRRDGCAARRTRAACGPRGDRQRRLGLRLQPPPARRCLRSVRQDAVGRRRRRLRRTCQRRRAACDRRTAAGPDRAWRNRHRHAARVRAVLQLHQVLGKSHRGCAARHRRTLRFRGDRGCVHSSRPRVGDGHRQPAQSHRHRAHARRARAARPARSAARSHGHQRRDPLSACLRPSPRALHDRRPARLRGVQRFEGLQPGRPARIAFDCRTRRLRRPRIRRHCARQDPRTRRGHRAPGRAAAWRRVAGEHDDGTGCAQEASRRARRPEAARGRHAHARGHLSGMARLL